MKSSHWSLQFALSVTLLNVCILGASGAEKSADAQVWFEKGLSLDVGVEGAPDAIQAFVAMRRAADSGDPDAAFNVAVMLDSGRGASRDIGKAAVWYARSAVRGERRGAYNLAMLYENGEGVPANVDLARSWYAAANLPAAREHLAKLPRAAKRPLHIRAPSPQFPVSGSTVDDLQQIELVWVSEIQSEPVRYFVELRRLDGSESQEVWSGFVDVSSVRLPLPAAANFAWRVSAVARGSGEYALSEWSMFSLPKFVGVSDKPDVDPSAPSEATAGPSFTVQHRKLLATLSLTRSSRSEQATVAHAERPSQAPNSPASGPPIATTVESRPSDAPQTNNAQADLPSKNAPKSLAPGAPVASASGGQSSNTPLANEPRVDRPSPEARKSPATSAPVAAVSGVQSADTPKAIKTQADGPLPEAPKPPATGAPLVTASGAQPADSPQAIEAQVERTPPKEPKSPATNPLAETHSAGPPSDTTKTDAADISHESGAALPTPTSSSTYEDLNVSLIPPGPARRSPGPEPTEPSVLIILTQTSVALPSDLNGKSVVIAGLRSISLKAVDSALGAVGASDVRLTEGKKKDIDRLVDGDVAAAVVAFVNPMRARSFPDIPGLHLLRVNVNNLSQ